MRLLADGTAPALWVMVVAKRATDRSIRQRRALLTIVSLRDSPIRVKRFYECQVLEENE